MSASRSCAVSGPVGVLTTAVIPFAGAAAFGAMLVLLWARLTGTPWPAIGFTRPRSWVRALAVGVTFGVGLKFVMKAVVMPQLVFK